MTVKTITIISLISNAYSISIDCPNMIDFARGLGMVTQQPTIWSQLQTDCCTANGVTCASQRVTQIVWNSMNLNGSINGAALPSGLQLLDLGINLVDGILPNTWPDGLQNLYLYRNQLSGSISSTWPSTLQDLDLNSNQFIGSIPSSWPSGLHKLYLGSNKLTGSISILWPSGLQYLHLDNNSLSGDISSLPSTLIDLGLGYNRDLVFNQFTGSLVLNQPHYIYIYNNLVTDLVVYNFSSLVGNCDLSNNPLLGNPNIRNLTMCTKNGLFNASLLQITTRNLTLI